MRAVRACVQLLCGEQAAKTCGVVNGGLYRVEETSNTSTTRELALEQLDAALGVAARLGVGAREVQAMLEEKFPSVLRAQQGPDPTSSRLDRLDLAVRRRLKWVPAVRLYRAVLCRGTAPGRALAPAREGGAETTPRVCAGNGRRLEIDTREARIRHARVRKMDLLNSASLHRVSVLPGARSNEHQRQDLGQRYAQTLSRCQCYTQARPRDLLNYCRLHKTKKHTFHLCGAGCCVLRGLGAPFSLGLCSRRRLPCLQLPLAPSAAGIGPWPVCRSTSRARFAAASCCPRLRHRPG